MIRHLSGTANAGEESVGWWFLGTAGCFRRPLHSESDECTQDSRGAQFPVHER